MKLSTTLFLVFSSLLGSAFVSADDHAMFTGELDPEAPMNAQTQLCTLQPGKTMAQYDRLQRKYIDWAKMEEVSADGSFVAALI